MISPWTIYQQSKESSLSPLKGKKGKKDPNKVHKRLKKQNDKIVSSENDPQISKESNDNKDGIAGDLGSCQSIDKLEEQGHKVNDQNSNGGKQNKIQHIEEVENEQNEKGFQDQRNLLNKNLDHLQLITDEQRSKQFLKNVVSDHLAGYLDNSKLLDFCKNQSSSGLLPASPKNRRSISNQLLIQTQRKSLTNQINSMIFLKCIKQSLRVEENFERQVDSNIEEVLEKLSYEFRPRVSEHEILLQKLLKNEKERMEKNMSGQRKENKKQSTTHGDNKNQQGKTSQKSTPKTTSKHPKQTHQQLLQTLKQDIDKSSIIKYLNQTESVYLEEQTPKKKTKNQDGNKSKQQLKTINLNINNQKLTEKLIYIGKKPVNGRVSYDSNNEIVAQSKLLTEGQNHQLTPLAHNQNPQSQHSQKQRKQNSKLMVENMIKQHMAVRESRKLTKQGKNQQTIDRLDVYIHKLKGKNNKASLGNLEPTDQSNLISPRLRKSRTLVSPIDGQPLQKHSHKKYTNPLSFSSPLIPPEFQLPRIMYPSPTKHNLSPSSKLLQLITNNILLSKNSKSLQRNSTQNTPQTSKHIIDQLFVKDKEKKFAKLRRNQSMNGKGKNSRTKEILREMNKKKLLSLDQQIRELKDMEREMGVQNNGTGVNDDDKQIEINQKSTPVKRKQKHQISPNGMHEAFNFMRRKPHQSKLTPLQAELTTLIEAQPATSQQDSPSQQQMNSSTMKFNDHQIMQDMNLMGNSHKIKN